MYHRTVRVIPLKSELVGKAMQYFSSLPEVKMQVEVVDGEVSFVVQAYIDKGGVEKVNADFQRFVADSSEEADTVVSVNDCLGVIPGTYDQVYPKTMEVYFPKEQEIDLSYVIHLLNEEEGGVNPTRLFNTTVVLPLGENEDKKLIRLQQLLEELHQKINEGMRFSLASNLPNGMKDYFYFANLPFTFS